MTRPFVARGASFEEALERIARAGYRHLHFGPSDRRADGTPAVPEGATPEHLAALADLCARHGLAPASIFPHRGGDLAAETLETFRADVDTARALGVRTLIMWGPWPYRQGLVERRPRAEILARYEEWFAAMPALAAHAWGGGSKPEHAAIPTWPDDSAGDRFFNTRGTADAAGAPPIVGTSHN